MHYYQYNIADYRKDTSHLTPVEHYIYRTLIDTYYLDEAPIKNDIPLLLRLLRLSNERSTTVERVLNDFFILLDGCWTHGRIERDIVAYNHKKESASAAGIASAAARKATKDGRVSTVVQRSFNGRSTTVQPTINHKPLTKNQEPRTNGGVNKKGRVKEESLVRGSRLPADWVLPKGYGEWALSEKPLWSADDVRKLADRFRDHWISVAGQRGVKLDWIATWRNWVRKEPDALNKPQTHLTAQQQRDLNNQKSSAEFVAQVTGGLKEVGHE